MMKVYSPLFHSHLAGRMVVGWSCPACHVIMCNKSECPVPLLVRPVPYQFKSPHFSISPLLSRTLCHLLLLLCYFYFFFYSHNGSAGVRRAMAHNKKSDTTRPCLNNWLLPADNPPLYLVQYLRTIGSKKKYRPRPDILA